jgi:hypothetical protein
VERPEISDEVLDALALVDVPTVSAVSASLARNPSRFSGSLM